MTTTKIYVRIVGGWRREEIVHPTHMFVISFNGSLEGGIYVGIGVRVCHQEGVIETSAREMW